MDTTTMPTYLFSWNPLTAFKWPNNSVNSAATRRGKVVHIRWSTGGTTCIVPGDRIFLSKVSQHPTGVIASGVAASDCFEDTHWEDSSKRTTYSMVDFDTILDPESVLPRSRLSAGSLGDVNWDTEYGGVTIGDADAAALEAEWRDWLQHKGFPQIGRELEQSIFQSFGYAGWIKLRLHLLLESDPRLLAAKRSEASRRNPGGLECETCRRVFKDAGGQSGIEVHDRRLLSTLKSTGDLDTTLGDLALVCANCHRMLHSQDWPSVEELRSRLVKQGGS